MCRSSGDERSGLDDLLKTGKRGERQGRAERGRGERDVGVPGCERGGGREEGSLGARPAFDSLRLGEQPGFCGSEVGVLTDVFDVLGGPPVERGERLALDDDAVEQIKQMIQPSG